MEAEMTAPDYPGKFGTLEQQEAWLEFLTVTDFDPRQSDRLNDQVALTEERIARLKEPRDIVINPREGEVG